MAEPTTTSGTNKLGGLLSSLRQLTATSLALLHTRLALLAVELEEEKRRLLRVLAWGAITVFLGCVGLVFLAGLVVLAFWDTHRVLACVGVTLSFFGLTGLAAWRVSVNLSTPGLLTATLQELQDDQAALTARQEGSP